MTITESLADRRNSAADDELAAYDFWHETVIDADGWEHVTPGDRYERTIYFQNADNPEGDSVKGSFAVIFDGHHSAAIREVYAQIAGNIFGSRSPAERDPREGEPDHEDTSVPKGP